MKGNEVKGFLSKELVLKVPNFKGTRLKGSLSKGTGLKDFVFQGNRVECFFIFLFQGD